MLDILLSTAPVIAILRGITPKTIKTVALTLYEQGIRVIEIPMNSPDAIKSLAILTDILADKIIAGTGTVLTMQDVDNTALAGGKIALSPNTNPDIIKHCLKLNIIPVPGIYTPSDAFNALDAGAQYLKFFPADTGGINHLTAMQAVLPTDTKIIPVGGIDAFNCVGWLNANSVAVGVGSGIFKASFSLAQISNNANKIMQLITA